jgi:hypothetical protein
MPDLEIWILGHGLRQASQKVDLRIFIIRLKYRPIPKYAEHD